MTQKEGLLMEGRGCDEPYTGRRIVEMWCCWVDVADGVYL